jgi:WD40 repeat protein
VLAFSPDGNLLAAVVGSRIIPWDLETRTRLPTLTGHGAAYAGGTGAVTAMAFAPVGRLLASVGREGTLRLWDPADPARPERARFEPGLGSLHAVAFSPDGTLVAVGGARGIALIDVDERLAG